MNEESPTGSTDIDLAILIGIYCCESMRSWALIWFHNIPCFSIMGAFASCFKRKISQSEDRQEIIEHVADTNTEPEPFIHDEYQRIIEDLRHRLEVSNRDKDDALRRLSEQISVKMRTNNPDIVNLDDQFRPTKLAEISSELYDNEWTNAFDVLEEMGFPDTDNIRILLDIVMESYNVCKDATDSEWNIVEEWHLRGSQDPDVDKTRLWLRERRKELIAKFQQDLSKKAVDIFSTEFDNDKRLCEILCTAGPVRVYLDACVRLCLYMVVQDPPVVWYCPGWTSVKRNLKDLTGPGDDDAAEKANEIGDNSIEAITKDVVAKGTERGSAGDADSYKEDGANINEETKTLGKATYQTDRDETIHDAGIYNDSDTAGNAHGVTAVGNGNDADTKDNDQSAAESSADEAGNMNNANATDDNDIEGKNNDVTSKDTKEEIACGEYIDDNDEEAGADSTENNEDISKPSDKTVTAVNDIDIDFNNDFDHASNNHSGTVVRNGSKEDIANSGDLGVDTDGIGNMNDGLKQDLRNGTPPEALAQSVTSQLSSNKMIGLSEEQNEGDEKEQITIPYERTLFKEYMQRGEFVEYFVWPAMRFNGNLLCKGVAQCYKRTK